MAEKERACARPASPRGGVKGGRRRRRRDENAPAAAVSAGEVDAVLESASRARARGRGARRARRCRAVRHGREGELAGVVRVLRRRGERVRRERHGVRVLHDERRRRRPATREMKGRLAAAAAEGRGLERRRRGGRMREGIEGGRTRGRPVLTGSGERQVGVGGATFPSVQGGLPFA